MEQTHLLDNIIPELVPASHGKRLVNCIVDAIAYYGLIFLFAIILTIFSPEMVMEDEYGNSPLEGLGWNLFFIVFYILYYICFEFFGKGRTLGKLITGTKAVMSSGSNLNISSAIKRSAIRMIPFEIFSYFGTPSNPWHDKWTDSMVMDIKKSTLN